jgi:hypothetical protein
MMRLHVLERIPPPDPQRDLDFLPQLVRPASIGLVHHEDVADFHDARFERLNSVA